MRLATCSQLWYATKITHLRDATEPPLLPTFLVSATAIQRRGEKRESMDQREVLLYTRSRSLRCWRAKRLLARRGYHFEVVETANEGLRGLLKQLTSSYYRRTVPYLFVDHRPVGGLAEILAFDSSGVLEHLIRDEL